MPGNEINVVKFLLANKDKISLPNFGVVKSIGNPAQNPKNYVEINSLLDALSVVCDNSHKKADIYINGVGVSIKQEGASFSYNRLQRADLLALFRQLKFGHPENILKKIDSGVLAFHLGKVAGRNRPWEDFFNENEFKALLEFLMMKGSPSKGLMSHVAEYVLEAPFSGISAKRIKISSFEEYFALYKKSFKIAIRRGWVGQSSNSEHSRALGLARKAGNFPWVFNGAVGSPRTGWRKSFQGKDRRTVYYLMIEKEC